MLFKNAIQKIHVYAYDSTTGAPKINDQGQITGYVSLDGTANAIDDTNPAQVDATNMPGIYVFDLTAAETNCDSFALYAKSSTASVRIEPIIGFTTAGAVPAAVAGAASGLAIVGSSMVVPNTQKVDVETIKTQTITCGAAVTIRADVGAASIVPTNTQFEARTLPSADYVVVTDTIAAVTAATVTVIGNDVITAASLKADAVTKIIDDFETQSQADPTGFHVNVKEINGTAQTAGDIVAAIITDAAGTNIAADIIALKTVADTIATDTTTDIPLTITTMQGNITTIMADTDLLDDAIGGLADIHTDVGTAITQATEANAHAHTIDGIVSSVTKGLVKVYDDMSKPGTAQTITAPADMALNSTVAKTTEITALDAVVDTVKVDTAAIKIQTDKLTFTVANQVDSNIQSINDVAITGNGGTGTEFGI